MIGEIIKYADYNSLLEFRLVRYFTQQNLFSVIVQSVHHCLIVSVL